eukprot:COSAG01_NODE_1427_length_10336_cov_12.761207_3_plen_994_part_00
MDDDAALRAALATERTQLVPQPGLEPEPELVEEGEPMPAEAAERPVPGEEVELARFRSIPELTRAESVSELRRALLHPTRRFQLGVTEHFFPWLRERIGLAGEELTAAVTTEQLVWGQKNSGPSGPGPIKWCITAVCKAEQCSFATWCVRHGHTHDGAGNALFAPVTTFVSHAWQGKFLAMTNALDQHTEAVTCPAFFVDIFLINQHVPPWKEAPSIAPNQVLNPSIQFCKFTLLVLTPFDNPIPLTRSWCIYEIHTTQLLGAHLDIRIPLDEQQRFAAALAAGEFDFNDWVRKIDIEQAEAFSQKDKAWILDMVRKGVGVPSLNASVVQELCEWLIQQGEAALAAVPIEERKTSVLIEGLADLLWRQGQAEKAAPLFHEVVAGRREALGPTHERTLAAMHILAKFLRTQGNVTGSEAMFSEVVELRTAHPDFGENHWDTLSSRRELAIVWRAQGKLDQAEAELEAVLLKRRDLVVHAEQVAEASEAELKPLRIDLFNDIYAMVEVLISQPVLATTTMAARRIDVADMVDEIIQGRAQLLGERHPHTLDARILRGQVCVRSGAPDKQAVCDVRAVLEESRKMLGSGVRQAFGAGGHHKTLRCMLLLAQMLDRINEYEEACKLASEAEAGFRAAFGVSHPETLAAVQTHVTISKKATQSVQRVSKQEPQPELALDGDILVSVGSKVSTDDRPDCAVLETRENDPRFAKISWVQTWSMGICVWDTDDGSCGWVEICSLRTQRGGRRCTAAVTAIPQEAEIYDFGGKYWDLEAQKWADIPPSPFDEEHGFWDRVCQCWQAPPSCYTGTASILLMDGTTKLAKDVQVGDTLLARSIGTMDHATTVMARLTQSAQPRKLIKIGDLMISAVHRIVYDGQWIEPPFHPGAEVVVTEEVLYNFVVDGCLPIVANNICVSTIGTYCEGSHDFQWPTHALWGSQKIVDILRQHMSWPEIHFGKQDNLIAVLKDSKFAEEYLVASPKHAHDLLRKYGWSLGKKT